MRARWSVPARSSPATCRYVALHIDERERLTAGSTFGRRRQQVVLVAAISAFAHIAAVSLLLTGLRYGPAAASFANTPREHKLPAGIVWLGAAVQSEAHGGGGGGDQTKAPPRKLEMPGRDAMTVPTRSAAAQVPPPHAQDLAVPIAQLDISALATSAAAAVVPGSIDGVPTGLSRGPGTGPGAGAGKGSGDGPGDGPGLGPGTGSNFGGGPAGPGTPGRQDPVVVRAVKPAYTAGAMQARIQGRVSVECVVTVEGEVARPHIIRSLDPVFGLDQEAVRAAMLWRFIPGRVKGHPVPVVVRIDLDFSLQ